MPSSTMMMVDYNVYKEGNSDDARRTPFTFVFVSHAIGMRIRRNGWNQMCALVRGCALYKCDQIP